MTLRRVVLVALTLAAPIALLWAADILDHLTGYYDPINRRMWR